jgi:hypothetical protein
MPRHSAARSDSSAAPSRGESVEALVALVFLAPFAGEETLGFQPTQHGVKRAFLDLEAGITEDLAEGVPAEQL